jgi:dTDP-4-dehydrorhamnose 3,5-epimerase-like enzyme
MNFCKISTKSRKIVYLLMMEYLTTSVSDVVSIDLRPITDDRGQLTYFEIQKVFRMLPCRVFFITTDIATTRGGHAHRLCNQVFICNSGNVRITCSDSVSVASYEMRANTSVLFVPVGIWVNLEFKGPTSITVLCDQEFMETEYVRDFEKFNLEKNVS